MIRHCKEKNSSRMKRRISHLHKVFLRRANEEFAFVMKFVVSRRREEETGEVRFTVCAQCSNEVAEDEQNHLCKMIE